MAKREGTIIGLVVFLAGLMLSGCGGGTPVSGVMRYKGEQGYYYECGNPKVWPFGIPYDNWDWARNMNEIHYAAWRGDLERVKSLLAADSDCVNAPVVDTALYIGTPLHWAAYAGHKDVVELLIRKGARVKVPQFKPGIAYATPLQVAAIRGHTDIVKLLLANGAEVYKYHRRLGSSWREYRSVLYCTLFWGQKNQEDIVRLLIANGADINASVLGDGLQESYLHAAISCRREDVAAILIDNGADVNPRNYDGRSPLHLAAEEGLISTARALIAKKADVNAKDNHGHTSLDLAGRKAVAKLLRKYGGKSGR